MSTDAPDGAEEPRDPSPPTEGERALRATALGVALGVLLAFLGRRTRSERRSD